MALWQELDSYVWSVVRSHIQTSLDQNFRANLAWKIVTLGEHIRCIILPHVSTRNHQRLLYTHLTLLLCLQFIFVANYKQSLLSSVDCRQWPCWQCWQYWQCRQCLQLPSSPQPFLSGGWRWETRNRRVNNCLVRPRQTGHGRWYRSWI